MLRFCRLNTEPGQTFGFELAQENNNHVIRNVKPDSSAGKTPPFLPPKKTTTLPFPLARAGLHNEDRLIEVNDENVTQRSHRGLTKTQQKNLSFILSLFFRCCCFNKKC